MGKKLAVLIGTVLLFLVAGYVSNRYVGSEPPLAPSASPAAATQAGAPASAEDAEASAREPAPAFELADLAGNRAALEDYKGKAVYLNFWTTWCKWCKKEMPALESVYRDYQGKGLVVLAIDVGEDAGKVERYIRENEYSFPVLLDDDKSVSEAYGVRSIPVSVLLDTEGRVAYQFVGAMNENQMRSAIDSLLQ